MLHSTRLKSDQLCAFSCPISGKSQHMKSPREKKLHASALEHVDTNLRQKKQLASYATYAQKIFCTIIPSFKA